MSRREVAAKLREALRLMNDTGRHWIKGDFVGEIEYDEEKGESEYGYCSVGAIRHVMGAPVEDPSTKTFVVEMALASVLPPLLDESLDIELDQDAASERIVRWNDAPDRTWDDIVQGFTRAAEKFESEEIEA